MLRLEPARVLLRKRCRRRWPSTGSQLPCTARASWPRFSASRVSSSAGWSLCQSPSIQLSPKPMSPSASTRRKTRSSLTCSVARSAPWPSMMFWPSGRTRRRLPPSMVCSSLIAVRVAGASVAGRAAVRCRDKGREFATRVFIGWSPAGEVVGGNGKRRASATVALPASGCARRRTGSAGAGAAMRAALQRRRAAAARLPAR